MNSILSLYYARYSNFRDSERSSYGESNILKICKFDIRFKAWLNTSFFQYNSM